MTTKPVSELPLDEAQLQAALAEGPCPGCRLVDGVWVDSEGFKCKQCHGTGRVPLLPGLRKPCTCKDGKFEVFSAMEEEYKGLRKRLKAQGVEAPFWYEHPLCQGRGWVPETDGWKAMGVAIDAGLKIEWNGKTENWELVFWWALVTWCRAQKEYVYAGAIGV